jgi:hypothetical protein
VAIVPIPEKPVLPNAPAFRDPAVQKFGQDLVRMLYSQMSLVARRANASVWIDPGDDQTAGKLLEFTGLGNKVAASSLSGVSPDNAEGLAALMAASVGIPVKTAHNAYVARSIVGTANQVDVTNGSGVSGNPTLSLPPRLQLIDKVNNGNAATAYVQFFSADGINYGYIGKGSSSDGDVHVSALRTGSKIQLEANNGVLVSFGQLQFPFTQNPSTDPNTLDDYEEGTWFPTVVGSVTAGTCSYSLRRGKYVKIGSAVHIAAEVIWTGHTGTGALLVSGVPFVNTGMEVALAAAVGGGVAWTGSVAARINDAATALLPLQSNTGSAISTISVSTSGEIDIGGTYYTS